MQCRIGKPPKVIVGLVGMFVSVLHHHISHLAECGTSRGFCTQRRVLLWKQLCHQLEIVKYANATTVKVCGIWVSKGLRGLEFAKAQQEACGAHILRFPNRICCHGCPHYECSYCRYQKNQYTAAAPADWPH